MRGPFTDLYCHLVWATWDRLPLITPEIKGPLVAATLAKCRDLKVTPIAVRVVSDHAHLLVRMPPSLAVSTFVKEVKGASSHLMTHVVAPSSNFKWQGAYSAFTLAVKDVPAVRAYIADQEQHHADGKTRPEWEARDSD